jgi:hydroxyacylglutathione hydrolase
MSDQPAKLKTVQFRYGENNLGYLIHRKKFAVAVDGGAVDAILSYLDQNGLTLAYVTNTHSHSDHTCGNAELLEKTGAEFISVSDLSARGSLDIEGMAIRVISTPGHTADSVCFYYGSDLLTGDTLFNGKVGRCFTGDVESFFASIEKILDLPDGTHMYAGHDYLLEYLETAEKLEPENQLICIYQEGYDPAGVLTATLGWEKKVNPFIRYNQPCLITLLKNRKLPAGTDFERFSSMLTLM